MRRVIALTIAVLAAGACTPATKTTNPESKPAAEKPKLMPISTSSAEAKKHYLKGRDYLEKLRFPQARAELAKAVEIDPDFAVAWLQLSVTQPSNKEFFEALQKAKEHASKASEAEQWWIQGFVDGINGDTGAQGAKYKMIVDAYPGDVRAHTLYGNYWFGSQQYEQAIDAYQAAVKLDPDYHAVYNQLGYSYRFMDRYDEAEAAFKKYIELLPNDPNPYDSYAELQLKRGKYDEAIASYRKALEVQPGFTPSHLGIATCLNFQYKYKEARQELQTMFDNAPDDGIRRAALQAMAVSYADEGHLDEAIGELKKAAELSQKIKDYVSIAGDKNYMGYILLEKGEYDKALGKFSAALKLTQEADVSAQQKENAKRHFQYHAARVAIAKGELDKAKTLAASFRSATEELGNPQQIQLAYELDGLIAQLNKDNQAALAAFAQANPQSPNVLHHKMAALKALGKSTEAEQVKEELASLRSLNKMEYSLVRWRMRKRTRASR